MASIDSETGSEGFCLLQEQGSGAYSQGISEEGFLHLMEMYAQKDNVETVWLALRKFECARRNELRRRYSNELQLLTPLPRLKLRAGQSVEFTQEGRVYLITVRVVRRGEA